MKIKGTKVGKTNITSTYVDNLSQSDVKEFTVTAVSLGNISSVDNSTYTGTDITPLPIITAVVNGETVELQNGRDYTLSYSNNKNAGEATITATGIGNYTGTLTTTFTINPKVVVLNWGRTTWVYDGEIHTVTCNVDNLESGDSCNVILTGHQRTDIGTQTVTATGLSNTNYTLTGATNTSVTLTIFAGMFVKISGVWTPVKRVYKKVSGEWVQQEFASAFDTSKMYLKKN